MNRYKIMKVEIYYQVVDTKHYEVIAKCYKKSHATLIINALNKD